MLFRKTRRYACASCGGTGKVDNAAAAGRDGERGRGARRAKAISLVREKPDDERGTA